MRMSSYTDREKALPSDDNGFTCEVQCGKFLAKSNKESNKIHNQKSLEMPISLSFFLISFFQETTSMLYKFSRC